MIQKERNKIAISPVSHIRGQNCKLHGQVSSEGTTKIGALKVDVNLENS